MFTSRKLIVHKTTRSLVRQVSNTVIPPVIRLGDTLPNCELYEDYPNNTIHIPDFMKGKNVVIFGVSGAFSPGCSKTHVPGYLKAANTMKKSGIDEIVCVSVNDAYVMGAWAEKLKTKTKIRMFADPTGCFIYSLGLGMNIVPLGGFRAQRFSMVVVDNILRELHVEPDGIGLCNSLADQLCYKMYLKSKNELS